MRSHCVGQQHWVLASIFFGVTFKRSPFSTCVYVTRKTSSMASHLFSYNKTKNTTVVENTCVFLIGCGPRQSGVDRQHTYKRAYAFDENIYGIHMCKSNILQPSANGQPANRTSDRIESTHALAHIKCESRESRFCVRAGYGLAYKTPLGVLLLASS